MQVARWSSPAVVMVCLLSSLSFSATPDRITGAIDSSKAIAMEKGLHPKAQSKYDQGPVEPSFPLSSITLFMSPSASQQSALNKLLAQQQDPKSPNYHKWLTPQQYGERFGLSQNDLNKVVSWLKSEGFVIQSVAAGRNVIVVSGTAGQAQSAFKAEIHRYNVEGQQHFANSTPIMIPAALQGILTGMIGVNDFRPHTANRFRLGSGPIARPNFYDGNLVFANHLGPADFATIYNIPSGLTGSNQKIAIMGETDLLLADLTDFRSNFGLPTITCSTNGTGVITACTDAHFKYVLTGGTDPGKPDSVQQGDIGEADLDVEWSAGVAPGAQIVYVNSPSPSGNGVFDSLTYAIQNVSTTGAYIISMSYGLCEQQSPKFETLLQQGAGEGITIVASAGDSGAADCDNLPPGGISAPVPYSPADQGLAVDYPGSSAYVISAGGTSISLANDSYPNPSSFWNRSNGTDFESAAGYIPELAWNDDETLLSYCENPYPTDTFCKQGNPPVSGWVDLTQSKNQTVQAVQSDIWINAGGGGASNCFIESGTTCTGGLTQPSWQTSLSVPNLPAAAAGVRWVPDVSFLASPDFPGYIWCTPVNPDASTPDYTSSCASGITSAVENGSVVGGTSASAPVFAGIVALLNQSLSKTTGLGDIHTTLYGLAAKPSNQVFHQPTGGDNIVYCKPNTPSGQPSNIVCPSTGSFGYTVANADPTTGYNLVAGLGSVNVANLVSAWTAATAQFTLSSTAASPATFMAGNSTTSTITVTPVSGSGFSGTVTFSCPGTTGITCSGNAVTGGSGSSTVTIAVAVNVAAGAYNVNVTGTSGAASSSTTVSINVTATNESFTLAATANPYAVNQGGTVTVTINVTPSNGFNSPLTFSCTDPASESTCTGPNGPTNTFPVSFMITTTAATARLQKPFERSRLFYAVLLPGLMGIVLTFGSRKRSLRGLRMLGLMLVLGVSTIWLGSCGNSNNSSSSNPGTPKQTYTFSVSATTGGSGAITGNSPYSFQVTVQ